MKGLLFISVVLILNSCTTPVEKYIRENEPNIQSLEIISEGDKDSVFSPYDEIKLLERQYNKIIYDMEQLTQHINDSMPKKDKLFILDSASNLYNVEMKKLKSITNKYFITLDYINADEEVNPETEINNAIAIRAKYRLNGVLLERLFYFDKNGERIILTDNDIEQAKTDIASVSYKLDGIKENIDNCMTNIKNSLQ